MTDPAEVVSQLTLEEKARLVSGAASLPLQALVVISLVGGAIGAVLLLLGPAVAGIGVLGGSLLGVLHRKGLGLDDNGRDRIAAELAGGKALNGQFVLQQARR